MEMKSRQADHGRAMEQKRETTSLGRKNEGKETGKPATNVTVNTQMWWLVDVTPSEV